MPTYRAGGDRVYTAFPHSRGGHAMTTTSEAAREPIPVVDYAPPPPEIHWPDQAPLKTDGAPRERLNHWLTLVQRGEVLTSYRVFLGLMEDLSIRRAALAQLAFAGLIDVQDRMLHNRSYT